MGLDLLNDMDDSVSFAYLLDLVIRSYPTLFSFYQLARRTPSNSPLSPRFRYSNRDRFSPRSTPRARPVS